MALVRQKPSVLMIINYKIENLTAQFQPSDAQHRSKSNAARRRLGEAHPLRWPLFVTYVYGNQGLMSLDLKICRNEHV